MRLIYEYKVPELNLKYGTKARYFSRLLRLKNVHQTFASQRMSFETVDPDKLRAEQVEDTLRLLQTTVLIQQ